MNLFRRRPSDTHDHSVEPPLSVHEGYPIDAELREALDINRPGFLKVIAQEIESPTPAQQISSEDAREIIGEEGWIFDRSMPGVTGVTSPDGKVRTWVARRDATEGVEN